MKFMNIIYAGSYLILKPMGLAPAAMAFLSGGLFGLLLLPLVVLYCLLFVLRQYIHGALHDAIVYLLWAFVAWYTIVMITDDTHCRVEDTCCQTPQDFLDQTAYEFFQELFSYFPMTVTPFSDKVKQQLARTDKKYVVGVHPHGIHCFPLTLLASPGTPFDTEFPGLVSGSSKLRSTP